jgi:hypothetical protein
MVLVLVLQMAAVLVGSDWSAEATSPQITGPLVALAPLGFIGLLTCLIGSRLENPQQQVTPLRAVVCVLSVLLAIGMLVAVPMSLSSGAGDLSQAQNIEQGRAAMKEARAFRDNPEQVASLGEQLAQAGQLAADASKDDKQRAAETMIDEQISQMATQLKRVESQKNRDSRQRLIGGTATAVVLAIAFVLLALTAVI